MTYEVVEVYTPDDSAGDRRRNAAGFKTDESDPLQIAALAMMAVSPNWVSVEKCVERLKDDNFEDQIDGYTPDDGGFSFQLFGNSGTWDFEVNVVKEAPKKRRVRLKLDLLVETEFGLAELKERYLTKFKEALGGQFEFRDDDIEVEVG